PDRTGGAERRSLPLPGRARADESAHHGVQSRAERGIARRSRGVSCANARAALDRTRFHRQREAEQVSSLLRLAGLVRLKADTTARYRYRSVVSGFSRTATR